GGRGDQPRSPRDGPRAPLPRRPLLSAERLPDPRATAARAPGRHPGARALLRGSIRPADAPAHRDDPGRGARDHAAMGLAWQRPRAGQPHRTSDDPVAGPEARNTSRRARAYRVPSRAVEWHGNARSAGAGPHPRRRRGSELVDGRSAGCRCPPRDEADHAAVVDQEARDHEARQIAIRRQLNPASSPRAARRARERLAGASSPQCATLVSRCVPGRAVGNRRWRLTADMQSASGLEWLRDLTTACRRSADPNPDSGWSQSCFDFHAGGQDMVLRSTLLELVGGVSDYAETDAEIVATIVHLVNSGQVQLCGNFRGARFDLGAATSRWRPEGRTSWQLRHAHLDLGSPLDVWEHSDASFSWSLNAIQRYAHREQWESVFYALVLLGDSDPKGGSA